MHLTAARSGRNVFEVLSRLPRQGVGARVARSSWLDDSYWFVTDVKISQDGKHGRAWGLCTWRGVQQGEQPKEITGPLKRIWRALPNPAAQQQPAWKSLAAEAVRLERAAAAAQAAAAEAPEQQAATA